MRAKQVIARCSGIRVLGRMAPVLEVPAPAREWDAERSLDAEVPF